MKNNRSVILEELNHNRIDEAMGKFQSLEDYFSKLKYPDKIVFTNNGYYDLEKQGLSGCGVWVGFEHGNSQSDKQMKKVLDSVINNVKKDMEKYISSNHYISANKVVIDDKTRTTDMYRVYFTVKGE